MTFPLCKLAIAVCEAEGALVLVKVKEPWNEFDVLEARNVPTMVSTATLVVALAWRAFGSKR